MAKKISYALRRWTIVLSGLLLVGASPCAQGVGVYYPACESEHDIVDSRKADLDKCIDDFNSLHRREDGKTGIQNLPDRDLPCVRGLKALMIAQGNLGQCMEKRIWWKSTMKKK